MKYKTPVRTCIIVRCHKFILNKRWLSSAGSKTKRVLTRAALEGSSDWLRGLKRMYYYCRLVPAGSAFLTKLFR
jgi:DNA-directed RNA polymerase subunit beta'